MNELASCSMCNAELAEDEQHLMEDECFCEDCYEDNIVTCSYCHERIWNDDNAGNSSTPLCEHCYDYHYTTCRRCGDLLSNDDVYCTEDDHCDENPYCYNCYTLLQEISFLHSYSYKPDPIFHGDGNRYFGVELEIDLAGKDEDNAKTFCQLANEYNTNIYIKTDSSLDDGMEIVTHPMTLDYHMQSMPWKSLMEQALSLRYRSHQAETCGLHIHVNRNSFTDNYAYQEECIARVLYLVERFWEELLRFSRRTQSQLKRWANRYGYKVRPEDILNSAKNDKGGRYTCVNLTNDNTIEFRIFRGTLKYTTLIATLQLVNELCEVAFSTSDDEARGLSWCDLMERISPDKCPELIQYLKERRLYVNEPVLCDAEV